MSTHARRIALPLAALATLVLALPISAKTVVVIASGMSFTPSTVNIDVGDSITFQNTSGFHNVAADGGSFRCADGCDDTGGNGNPASGWSFTRSFTQAGTIGFHCEVHGSVSGGMRGTIVVSGGSPSEHNGALQFSAATYAVTEGTAQAQISVTRTGGDDGAVSVHYATNGQTATAGSDFTSASGTLNWAAGDDASKSFSVPITNDAAVESNETVQLVLSSPTGGAALGNATAVLTIHDNDSPGGTIPPAPAKLHATSTSLTGVVLAWQDKSTNETLFRVQGRRLDEAAFTDRGTAAANTTQLAVNGLPSGVAFVFRVRAENATGNSAFSQDLLVTTDVAPAACVADAQTLCLSGGRFSARIDWRTASGPGQAGAIPLPANPDSGLFYFFAPANIEALLKTLNACTFTTPRYWVFLAATTDVEFTARVTDTATGKVKTYFNVLGQPAPPVQDTDAFATCP